MKTNLKFTVTLALILAFAAPAFSALLFSDKPNEFINSDHSTDTYYVGFMLPTIVSNFNLGPQGVVEAVSAYGVSSLLLPEGTVLNDVQLYNGSSAAVAGTDIGGSLKLFGESMAVVNAGTIADSVETSDGSIAYIVGTGFVVNSIPVSIDTGLSSIAPAGNISGVLENGDPINVTYSIADNADVVLIVLPEPTVFCFLIIGSLLLLRRSHAC